MEGVINPLCQFGADAVHAGNILDAGPSQLFQATELPEQRLPAFGPDTRNAVERRGGADLRPALAMAGNSEAMRLVTDLLH